MSGPRELSCIKVVGRYALYNEIASGGMATVHLGRLLGPVGFSRTVAIKRLHAHLAKDPEFTAMFLDEARLAARIHHPNVVPTLDVVALDGELFLVMEYVHGESLARLFRTTRKNGQPIPPGIAVAIMSGVLQGLHAAHEAKNERGEPLNMVHRDISPQNILVGTDGMARIVDFGVAKAIGQFHSTRDGQLKGKVAYMPHEQIRGRGVSRQTDIYAASVVLWEALTGRSLFRADNDVELLYQVLESKPIPPSSIIPDLPPALDAVVVRGLAHDPSARFASANDMVVELENAFAGVSQRTVGEWIEKTASNRLALRANEVAEVESVSAQFLPAAEVQQHITPSSQQDASLSARRSHANLSAQLHATPSTRQSHANLSAAHHAGIPTSHQANLVLTPDEHDEAATLEYAHAAPLPISGPVDPMQRSSPAIAGGGLPNLGVARQPSPSLPEGMPIADENSQLSSPLGLSIEHIEQAQLRRSRLMILGVGGALALLLGIGIWQLTTSAPSNDLAVDTPSQTAVAPAVPAASPTPAITLSEPLQETSATAPQPTASASATATASAAPRLPKPPRVPKTAKPSGEPDPSLFSRQ